MTTPWTASNVPDNIAWIIFSDKKRNHRITIGESVYEFLKSAMPRQADSLIDQNTVLIDGVATDLDGLTKKKIAVGMNIEFKEKTL